MFTTVYDLGLPIHYIGGVAHINRRGGVAGYVDDGRSFRSTLTSSPALLGAAPGYAVWAFALNDDGNIVGRAVEGLTDHDIAFVFGNAGYTFLSEMLGSIESYALDINDDNRIVGSADFGHFGLNSRWAYILDLPTGQVTDLSTIFGRDTVSLAVAVNGRGQVLGVVDDERGPFVYDDGDVLDPSEGEHRWPVDLNDGGQVVLNGEARPVLFDLSGKPTIEIPVPYGTARAINNDGVVVGTRPADPFDDSTALYAWRWSESDGAEDLESLTAPSAGWHLADATDVNDKGVIVGTGRVHGRVAVFQFGGEVRGKLGGLRARLEQQILYGVVQDGGGAVRRPGHDGPVPVGPWGPRVQDVLASLAQGGRAVADAAEDLAQRLREPR
jgi:uncharacterized membrane protein